MSELASIGTNGIERVRAVTENVRTRSFAMVGRMAAQFNHECRNRLEVVIGVLEALRDGKEGEVSPQLREAVLQQVLELSEDHNFALEITRVRPGQLVVRVNFEAFFEIPTALSSS